MKLNFKYLPKLGHAIAINISHGRILTNKDSNENDEGDNTIESWLPYVWVDDRKNISIQANGNNVEVMAELVKIGMVRPKDDGYTVKAMADFMEEKVETNLPENKYAVAVEKYGKVIEEWHTNTIKSVNDYFGFEDADKEVMIENIKTKI